MSQVRIGMEYELEGLSDPQHIRGWKVEEDGTLRDGGWEYLFDGPADIGMAKARVSRLLSTITEYDVSHRCSSHIHIDTSTLSANGKLALCLGLLMHDNWFYKYGEGRELNNYCCPVWGTANAFTTIHDVYITNGWSEDSERFQGDTKYMSINTMPLFRSSRPLGTIELRHFHPLMDQDQAYAVLDRIEAIYNSAAAITARENVIQVCSESTFEDIEDQKSWVHGIFITYKQLR